MEASKKIFPFLSHLTVTLFLHIKCGPSLSRFSGFFLPPPPAPKQRMRRWPGEGPSCPYDNAESRRKATLLKLLPFDNYYLKISVLTPKLVCISFPVPHLFKMKQSSFYVSKCFLELFLSFVHRDISFPSCLLELLLLGQSRAHWLVRTYSVPCLVDFYS